MAEVKNVSAEIEREMQRAGLDIAAVRKTLLQVSQGELAKRAGIGLSTMVAIEKGALNVQIGHWLAVLQTLGLTQGLPEFASIGNHPEMLEAIRQGTPKRSNPSRSSRG